MGIERRLVHNDRIVPLFKARVPLDKVVPTQWYIHTPPQNEDGSRPHGWYEQVKRLDSDSLQVKDLRSGEVRVLKEDEINAARILKQEICGLTTVFVWKPTK